MVDSIQRSSGAAARTTKRSRLADCPLPALVLAGLLACSCSDHVVSRKDWWNQKLVSAQSFQLSLDCVSNEKRVNCRDDGYDLDQEAMSVCGCFERVLGLRAPAVGQPADLTIAVRIVSETLYANYIAEQARYGDVPVRAFPVRVAAGSAASMDVRIILNGALYDQADYSFREDPPRTMSEDNVRSQGVRKSFVEEMAEKLHHTLFGVFGPKAMNLMAECRKSKSCQSKYPSNHGFR
jgi:hypothetical protein